MNHKFCLLAVFQLSRAAKNGIFFFCRAVIMLLNFERQRAKGTRQVTAITCQDIISCVEYSDYSLCHFETSMKNSINNWPFFLRLPRAMPPNFGFKAKRIIQKAADRLKTLFQFLFTAIIRCGQATSCTTVLRFSKTKAGIQNEPRDNQFLPLVDACIQLYTSISNAFP